MSHKHTPDFVKKDMSDKAAAQSQDTQDISSEGTETQEDKQEDKIAVLKTDYEGQLMRLHAEMENLRKRSQKDIEKAHKYGLDRFATDLLPIIDSLEQGLSIDIGDNVFAKNIHNGLEMTLSLFLNTLGKFGIKPVNPLNEPFTPDLHQAISTEENKTVAPNTVLKVLQKGYTLNDRLIRPALVIVAK